METTSGVLLLVAAAVALLWANSPWREAYAALSDFTVGPAALHLSLPMSAWAADGLLAVFFFVVGVELKHELVAGSLRHPREAAVPVLAAVGGMALPAVLFVAVILLAGDREALHGWAIPTATDIAFALAVLAIFGRGLPRALRTFLLTLAV
ncbi:MAG: Na+/H+ antiporter NhaA, partial [Propionibacteriaceae bacterium]|nr:Na+/H+ antiporter NhaA [Propionibacteriaceae bacterium]